MTDWEYVPEFVYDSVHDTQTLERPGADLSQLASLKFEQSLGLPFWGVAPAGVSPAF